MGQSSCKQHNPSAMERRDLEMPVSDKIVRTVSFLGLLTAVSAGHVLGEEGSSLSSPASHFTFTKKGCLTSPSPTMPKPGPYYTCLVSMKDVEHFPYDYALYFSTDHNYKPGDGGIWMWVCNGSPTKAANWKSYDWALANGKFDYLEKKPAANPIFVDTTQGRQTETPYVNIIDGVAYMTYHNDNCGRRQSTLLATSQDGVNFARIHGDKNSIILAYTDPPGDGHTGYFRWGPNPFSGVKHKYVGYSLHGGTRNYFSAMWGSDNAVDWVRLQVFVPREGAGGIGKDTLLIWHELDPNSITSLGNGEYVAICAGGNRAAGPVARRVELYEVFLANDGKTMTRACRKILGQGPAGADDHEELSGPTTSVIGNTWHLIYVGTTGKGRVNTVMGASGKLDKTAPKGPAFTGDRQWYFYR